MSRRDRVLAFLSVLVVAALAALIATTVLDAQRRARRALERQKLEQIEQLARSMDTRIEQAYAAFQSIAALPFTLEPGSPADREILEGFQRQSPGAQGGYLLLDADGRVVNGTLLRDPSVIGEMLDREGLDDVRGGGGAAVLPVEDGLTTALPTLGLAAPIAGPGGEPRGVFLIESAVSAESAFNQEVANLGGGDSGEFYFVDQNAVVVASSNTTALGRPIPDADRLALGIGFHRTSGEVVVIEPVESAGWRAVFSQDAGEFEGGLGQRLQSALLLVVVAGVALGGVAVIASLNRLRGAREEQRRLEELNRTREEFISVVSHELRTPVAGVLGFLQTTLDHWGSMSDEERQAAVTRARSNARRLQALSRDVLDASGIEEGRITYAFARLDLVDEVRSAVSATREAHTDRTVNLDVPGDAVWVDADADRIAQVVMNLLDNAVQSSPAGSAIDVALERRDGSAVVSVSDQGAGLSEGEREAVFEKWVRGRATHGRGTGLGLYVSREIVRAHGGQIWVDHQRAGATFRFAVPTADAAD